MPAGSGSASSSRTNGAPKGSPLLPPRPHNCRGRLFILTKHGARANKHATTCNPHRKATEHRPAMTHNPLPPPADACAPDTDRAGPDAPARLPEWLVHLIALVIRFILQRSFAESSRHAWLPSWYNYRLDLAVRLGAATRRVETWRVRQRHRLSVPPPRHRPSHPEWPSLSRAIVAFGGSIKGFRRGLPACGLQWWENPDIVPGILGATACPPAADAMALLLSRQTVADTRPPSRKLCPPMLPCRRHLSSGGRSTLGPVFA